MMSLLRAVASAVGAFAAMLVASAAAFAESASAPAAAATAAPMGQPHAWQVNLQAAGTPVMESIHSFNTFLLVIITSIVLFVLVLLVTVMLRFNERANPVPSKTSHNTLIEVVWTVVPVMILVAIAIPSFRLLHLELNVPAADITVKAVGHQWYWSYEYPDNGNFGFDSLMLTANELKPGQPRLLAVDNDLVVPVNKNVRVQVTAADVIHSFAMPSFGIKIDAIPGRLNETWFRAEKVGTYYGQCSELCGKDHAFMPIAIRVLSEADFAAWVNQAKAKYASAADAAGMVADASAAR